MQRGSKIFKRASKIYKVDTNQEAWVDEVECRGEELCMVKPQEMREVMHSNIGAIVSSHHNKNGPAYGTGFLISDNLVLTCAHNIYDRHDQVYFTDILFYPGACGQLRNPFEVQSFKLPDEFLYEKSNVKSIMYDYAIIKLKRPVKHTTFLTLAVGFNNLAQALAIFGYPAHKYQSLNKTATLKAVNQFGLILKNRITMGNQDKNYKRILYEITTYPGESGCPVILGTHLHDKVIAIHKGGNQSLQRNYGRLITLDLLVDIQIWREEISASPFRVIDLRNSTQISFVDSIFQDIKQKVKSERKKLGNNSLSSEKTISSISSSGKIQLFDENNNLKNELNEVKKQRQRLKAQNQKLIQIQEQLQLQIIQQKSKSSPPMKSSPYEKKAENSEKKFLRSLRSFSVEHSQFQPEMKKIISDSPQTSYFQWDTTIPYSGKFFVVGKRVTLTELGTYQIVSLRPLNLQSKLSFQVVRYGGEKQIGFGIVAGSLKGKMYSGGLGDEESVGYWSYKKYKEGEIFVNGRKEVQWTPHLHLEEGRTILQMSVDLLSLIITFEISSIKFKKEFKLPDSFKKKDVYAFACMKQKGDSIDAIQ